jgi:hypothetical protein
MRRYVGIDPGYVGAAVCLSDDGRTVLHVARWSTKAPKVIPGRIPAEPTLPRFEWLLPTDLVALEQQFVGKSARGSVSLSIWSEKLMRTLPPEIAFCRPLATTWRGKVFGRSRLSREVAKRFAIAAAARDLARFGITDTKGDTSEAWCMARYAWGWDLAGRP